MASVYDFTVKDIHGKPVKLDRYDWRDVASVPAISLRVVSAGMERFDLSTVTGAFGDNPGIPHTP